MPYIELNPKDFSTALSAQLRADELNENEIFIKYNDDPNAWLEDHQSDFYVVRADKPKDLSCSCCGRYYRGAQSHKHDRGYGTCPRCEIWIGRQKWGRQQRSESAPAPNQAQN